MKNFLDFDRKKLEHLIDEFGIHQAWLNILKTHIRRKTRFEYILNDEFFKNSSTVENDIIDNLSINEISVLYEYALAYLNYDSKKENGQYFTPEDISILMASYSKKFDAGIWYDPCSGVGNLSWHLVNIQEDKEGFLKNNIVLSDKDELALLIARVLFTLSFQDKDDNLFNSIKNNFIQFDFLEAYDDNAYSFFSQSTLHLIPKHDYVIVNPPYLNTNEDTRFETAKCSDLYAYFLENIIKTSKGFISITPQSYTNAEKFTPLRKLLLKNFDNLMIYNFDNVPDSIFKGIKFGSKNTNTANSVRASIIIAGSNKKGRFITSLLRWQTSERKQMLRSIDNFLSTVELKEEFFPKVNNVFEKYYNDISHNPTLSTLISKKETEYPLYIPSSPRYFISALKKPANRASQKTLYFRSAQNRDSAYILINSTHAYWWWRVRDGGMTLSLETLCSLPLIDYQRNNDIILKLEKSENENKVYKLNAGTMQENIKHPLSLIDEINTLLISSYNLPFIQCHANSDLKFFKTAI
jgi:hypothetical protein